jgi:hypothetical protein
LNEKKIFYISFTSRGGGASQGDEWCLLPPLNSGKFDSGNQMAVTVIITWCYYWNSQRDWESFQMALRPIPQGTGFRLSQPDVYSLFCGQYWYRIIFAA